MRSAQQYHKQRSYSYARTLFDLCASLSSCSSSSISSATRNKSPSKWCSEIIVIHGHKTPFAHEVTQVKNDKLHCRCSMLLRMFYSILLSFSSRSATVTRVAVNTHDSKRNACTFFCCCWMHFVNAWFGAACRHVVVCIMAQKNALQINIVIHWVIDGWIEIQCLIFRVNLTNHRADIQLIATTATTD